MKLLHVLSGKEKFKRATQEPKRVIIARRHFDDYYGRPRVRRSFLPFAFYFARLPSAQLGQSPTSPCHSHMLVRVVVLET